MQLAMSFALESLRLGAVPLTGPLSVQPDTTPKAAAREALMPMSGGPEGHDTGKVTYQGASWVQQGGAPHVFCAEQLPPPAVPSTSALCCRTQTRPSRASALPGRTALFWRWPKSSAPTTGPIWWREQWVIVLQHLIFCIIIDKGFNVDHSCTGIQIGVSDVHLLMEADHSLNV